MQDDSKKSNADRLDAEYEAPGIEAVMTPEELEREVLYGGNGESTLVCSS